MLKRTRARFAVFSNRRRFEEGMNEDLGFHLDAYAADLVRVGVIPPGRPGCAGRIAPVEALSDQ